MSVPIRVQNRYAQQSANNDDRSESFELRERPEASCSTILEGTNNYGMDDTASNESLVLTVTRDSPEDSNRLSRENESEPVFRQVIPTWRPSSYGFSGLFTNWWLWELSSWLLAVISILLMVTVLRLYDNKPTPEWPYGITINALVSALVTTLNIGLLFPVAESISQIKWLWYRTPRKLYDFEVFNAASKGPLGAAQLLLQLGVRHTASVGALVMLLALGIGPFSQLIIAYPDRWRDRANSTVYLSTSDSFDRKPTIYARASMEALLLSGAIPDHARLLVEQDNRCGRFDMCDWPIYDTLAVCNDCEDFSDSLQYRCISEQKQALCGYYSNVTRLSRGKPEFHTGEIDSDNFTYMTIHNHHGLTSERMPKRQWPLNSFVLAYQPWRDDSNRSEPPVTMECLIYPCVKRRKTMRKFRKFSNWDIETFRGDPMVTSSFFAVENMTRKSDTLLYDPNYRPHRANITIDLPAETTEYPWLTDHIKRFLGHDTVDPHFLENSVKFSSRPTRYLISSESANRLAWLLETRLNSSAVLLPGNTRHRRADYMVPISDTLDYVPQNRSILQDTIRAIVDNITEGLTMDLMNRGTRKSSNEIIGHAQDLKRHVDVRWIWLTLPLLLTIVVLILLLKTMGESIKHGVPLWRSSATATLLQSVKWRGEYHHESSRQLLDMETLVGKACMELDKAGDGAHLAGCICQVGNRLPSTVVG